MDNNEFDLDELLDSSDFAQYESVAAICAKDSFLKTVSENSNGEKAAEKIRKDCEDMMYYTQHDAFKQGFCFAVKTIKFLLKS